MPCEQYQEALIDLACAGTQPRSDLRAHLDVCPSCRASLERERLLFAAIDSGVREMANAELPVNLLPRLHAHLAQEGPHKSGALSWAYVTAFAAVLILALLPFFRLRNAVEQTASREMHQALPQHKAANQQTHATPTLGSRTASQALRTRARRQAPPSNPSVEVIVPSEERDAFARFISAVAERPELASALSNPAAVATDNPIVVEPLQIARLEVKPLEGEGTELDAER